MLQHLSNALLAAGQTNPESGPTKSTLPVTEPLKVILRDLFFDSEGCASAEDRRYAYDASRGNQNTIDVARVALMVRRCHRTAPSRVAWKNYLASMVEHELPALPVDRAALRKAKEVGEASVATEKYRVRPCPVAAAVATRENNEAIASLVEMNRSIAAEAATLSA